MVFKINIGTKQGKTYKLETESKALVGKELHQKIQGKDVSPELEGYEFEIAGASDSSGFTALSSVEGEGLKKVLLSYEKGMKKRPRHEGKKKRADYTPKGLRLRKTVRGKVISPAITQINLKIIKEGKKSLKEIFEKPEAEAKVSEETPKKEEKKPAEKKEEKTEEKTEEEKTQETEAPKEEKKEETEREAKESKEEKKPMEEKK